MSGREGSPKISLALLKGRSSNQSVPTISFRFDPTAENLTQISDQEEDEDTLTTSLEASGGGPAMGRAESLRDSSPVKDLVRGLGKRSSSLDSSSGGDNPGSTSAPTPPRTTDTGAGGSLGGGGLLSRLTKTFEDKINEIRKDKDKDRPISEWSTESESSIPVAPDRSPTHSAPTTRKDDDLGSGVTSGSPPKQRTSIVQDITGHTSKIKSELGSIRPKLSELRQRRNKDKVKTSVFTSLLGRDEGMGEDMLVECDEGEVDRAEEATESTTLYTPNELTAQMLPTQITSITQGKTPNSEQTATLQTQILETVEKLPITLPFFYKFLTAVFIVAFVLPIPPFVSGLVVGIMLSALIMHCLLFFILPSQAEQNAQCLDEGPFVLKLPTYEDKQLYKGWMNKLEGEYSPDTYHVSHTHSVLLRLQGARLKLDFPRGKVPKHARQKEEIRHLTFTHHLEYDLSGAQVTLLPRNLPRRWLWSRKYPICIQLAGCSKESSPSPVSITSTPAGSAQGSPIHTTAPGRPHTPPLELYHQGSSESGEGNWSLENNLSGEEDGLNSSVDIASFEEVTRDMCQERCVILFARCDREKDDWFRRLIAASELPPSRPQHSSPAHKPQDNPGGDTILLEGLPDTPRDNTQERNNLPAEMSFERYMAKLLYLPPPTTTTTTITATTTTTTPTTATTTTTATTDPSSVAWINALAGRIFYDFLRNPIWANKVQERVQRKLSKLHIPYFVGDLVVCGVNMGSATPHLHSAGTPHMDGRGLWVDLEVEYSGNFTLSLETKLDLMKLKRTGDLDAGITSGVGGVPQSLPPSPGEQAQSRVYTRSPSSDRLLRNLHFDTDTDDSVESSSEEEEEEDGLAAETLPAGGSGPTSRRLLRLVDTVAASRYFQHAAEWRLLQRALQGVSNTRIELSVEVRHLSGTLALNVPPPPTDRLWYGFKGSPMLTMVARPRLGDRALSLPILVEFIQRQLKTVFEKVFVLPNMDDLVIPIMSPLLPGQHTPPKPPWETTHTHQQPQEYLPPQSPPRVAPHAPVVKFTPSSH